MHIVGTDGDDRIKLPGEDNIVRTGRGNDRVWSADERVFLLHAKPIFHDLIHLGAGDDRVTGFVRGDTIHGGAGDDLIRTGGFDDFRTSFSGDGKLFGGRGDDRLSGGSLMDGGAGDDTLEGAGRMIGGKGDDTYVIHSLAGDVVDRKGASDITIFFAEGYPETSGAHRIITADRKDIIRIDWLENAEFAVRSGDRADYVIGADTVDAGSGNDTISGGTDISGGDGRDLIRGGTFVDGGAGNDRIERSGAAGGKVEGGLGDDTIVSSGNAWGGEGEDVLEDCIGAWGGAGNDTLTGCEDARGGAGDDVLDDATDAQGGGGNDSLTGRGMLRGDNGDDTLDGTSADGSASNDSLFGGRGADILRFAYENGVDVLEGGSGADIFVLKSFLPDEPAYLQLTADTIADFGQGIDRIDLAADADLAVPDGFTGREGVRSFDDLVIEQAGDDVAIKDGEGYVLVLVAGQRAGDFTADDFLF